MRIVVLSGLEQGREITLPPATSVIGSDDRADVRLRGAVSPRHVRVTPAADGSLLVEPLDDPQPAYVDRTPVLQPTRLEPGMRLQVGDVLLTLAPAAAPVPSPPGGARPGTLPPPPPGPPGAPGAPGAATPWRYGRVPPTGQDRRRRRRIVGVVIMGVLGLLTFASVVAVAGPQGAFVSLAAAVVPAPLLVAVVLLIDRYEPEPTRVLVLSFLFGATAATFLAGILNAVGFGLFTVAFGPAEADLFTATMVAPVVEEVLKASVLVFLFWRMRHELNGVVDGIVFAAMVGLGFAVTENMTYYAQALMEGQDVFVTTLVLRGVFSPFAHPLFTAMTGIGFALAIEGGRGRALLPLAGLAAAIGLHALWNLAASFGAALLVAYVVVFVPLLIVVIVVAVRAMRHEERVLRTYLQPDVASGLLTLADVDEVASLQLRRRAEREAGRRGRDAKALTRQFHHAATELAFLRHRRAVGRGRVPGAADEARWTEAVRRLKARLAERTSPPW